MPPVASWGVPAGRVAGSAATGGGPPTGMECCRFFPALCLDFIFSPSHRLSTFIFLLPSSRILPRLLSLCCIHHAPRPTGVFGRFYVGRNDFFSHRVLKLVIE